MTHKSYFAVIPATVRYSRDVPDGAKLLYGEITALANEHGYCWATNKYFAELYEASERTVSRWISDLARAGFIFTLVDKNSANSRKIWLSESQMTIDKNSHRVTTKTSIGYRQKCREAIDKNVLSYKENNTMNNTVEEEKAASLSSAASKTENSTLEAEEKKAPPLPPPPPIAVKVIDPETPGATIYDHVVYPGQPTHEPAAEYSRVDISKEVDNMRNDPAALEGFVLVRKLPHDKFQEYLDAFKADVLSRCEKYQNVQRLRSHFFNWSEKHHGILKRDAQQTSNTNTLPRIRAGQD
mgnify:FL=1